jgi:Zn-dependent peptidase ImmA (M78 family)
MGLAAAPVPTMVSLCERAGQLVLVTSVPGDGASVIDGDVAASVVSSTGDPGRRRATAAHELGHFLLGDEYSSDLGVHASRSDREAVVDAFAAELLLPVGAFEGAEGGSADIRDLLIGYAARYRASLSLALKQAEHARLIDGRLRGRLVQPAPTHVEFREALGWAPEPDLATVRVPPAYAHAVFAAWRDDLITTARAIKLMHGEIAVGDLPPRDDFDVA